MSSTYLAQKNILFVRDCLLLNRQGKALDLPENLEIKKTLLSVKPTNDTPLKLFAFSSK